MVDKIGNETRPTNFDDRVSDGPSRRQVLKAAALSSLAAFSFRLAKFAFPAHAAGDVNANDPVSAGPAKNPPWYGFNLLEYFSTDTDWTEYFPYKNDGMFVEDDFRWIRDWGFNWVRLPMDYRFWTSPDLVTINERAVEPIDRAIRLGEKYGVHVNICLHRAPGLCILDLMDVKLTGISVTKEKTNVYSDTRTFDAFVRQWVYFAERYKHINSNILSFNLVNEPIVLPSAAEVADLEKKGPVTTADLFSPEMLNKHAADYIRLARASNNAILAHDPKRLVVTDGYPAGVSPIPSLTDTGMLQSCHTYTPMPLTHYRCEWARGMLTGSEPIPAWPLKDQNGKIVCDGETLRKQFQPWRAINAAGAPIHFGEMGCYKHTPPEVVLAWFDDTLDVIGELKSGWALWNFRGPFGVVDTERAGTKFEDWHGHKLDRPLLTLLQSKIKKA